MAYGFDDGHIAVGTVHSAKHVPTHQSSITTVPSGTDCQICHELRQSDRKQIRLQVARESGAVREILIQKVPKNPDKPKLETLLKLNRQQSNQLINLFKALDSIPVEGEKHTNRRSTTS